MHRTATTRTESWKESRPFLVLWGVLLVVLEGVGATAARHASLMYDFRTFYAAGYLLRTRPADLYSLAQQKWVQDHLIAPGMTLPFFSPAYEALLFAPFSLMTYRAAYLSFLLFNLLLLLAAFWIARDTFRESIPIVQPRPGLMLLVFFPVLIALLHGQVSVMLLLACCATWTALKKGRVGLAGLVLAVGICKFNLILPIALILALRWGRRFVAGFAGGAAAAVGASVLVVGTRGMAMLTTLLRAGSLATSQGAAVQDATAVFPKRMSSLYALIYGTTHGLQRPGLTFVLTMVLSVAIVAVCAWVARREQRDEVAFSVAILCGLLVSYHLYIHDVSLLVLPLILLQGIRRYKAVVLASYALPVLVLFSIGVDFLYLLALIPLWAVWLVVRSQRLESQPSVCLEPVEASA